MGKTAGLQAFLLRALFGNEGTALKKFDEYYERGLIMNAVMFTKYIARDFNGALRRRTPC